MHSVSRTTATVAIVLFILAWAIVAYAGELPQVRLNEVVSHPETGGKEWVELYNAGDAPIDLAGWYLTDLTDPQGVASSTTLKLLEGIIEPDSYLVVEVGTTKLNNGGDSVGLYSPDFLEVDSVTLGPNVVGYTANSRNPAEAGFSSSRFGSMWIVGEASKGLPNVLPRWSR